jgi:hypothetical protein
MSSQNKKLFRMSLSENLQTQELEKQTNNYLKLSRKNLLASNLSNNFDTAYDNEYNISEISFNHSVTSEKKSIGNNLFRFNKSNTPSLVSFKNKNDDLDSVVSLQSASENNFSLISSNNPVSERIPNEIKRFILSFQGTKQDRLYRKKYNIPEEFDVYYYLQRYPKLGHISKFNFKRIVSLYRFYEEKAKDKLFLDDKYYRLKYWIPDNFDCRK